MLARINRARVLVAALALALAATLAALAAQPAQAGDTRCTGTLSGGTYDNVVVPRGATCDLIGSTVKGSVKALRDSTLRASGNQIRGNIETTGARMVYALDNTVGGNVLIKESVGDPAFNFDNIVSNNDVGGNIELQKNRAGAFVADNRLTNGNIKVEGSTLVSDSLRIDNNTVAQDLQVFNNRGPGDKGVEDNTVRMNLQCSGNDQPFLGGPNVARNAQGQCF